MRISAVVRMRTAGDSKDSRFKFFDKDQAKTKMRFDSSILQGKSNLPKNADMERSTFCNHTSTDPSVGNKHRRHRPHFHLAILMSHVTNDR